MPSPDLQFLHGNHMARCAVQVDKVFAGYHSLQLMTRGAVVLSYDERVYELSEPTLWPAMPGPRIRFGPAPGHAFWDHRYVAFTGRLVDEWAAAGLLLAGPVPLPANADYPRLFDELHPLLARPDVLAHRRAVNLLERILLLLAEAQVQLITQPEWLREVLAVLELPRAEPNYQALAARVGMAPSTLRRRFKETMGQPLHQYLLQQRLSTARNLLAETDASIQEIADQLGYRDVYFFSRQFKQYTGVPPGLFRRTRQ